MWRSCLLHDTARLRPAVRTALTIPFRLNRLHVTPLEQPHVEGILAEQGLADRFFLAVRRGMAMKVDISDGWDHWAWVDRPIDVRAALGVLPVE